MPLENTLKEELKEAFDSFAVKGNLNTEHLSDLFKAIQEPIPPFRIREMMEKYDADKNNLLSFSEFINMFEELDLNKAWAAKLRTNVQARSGVIKIAGSEQSAEGTVHSLSDAERDSFANVISRLLKDDPDIKSLLPIKPSSSELFTKVADGIILCKLVNKAVPNTIDERTINKKKLNKFTMTENLNLGINSCSAIGCHVVNISSEDISQGKPHLVLGLVWQVIRIYLLSAINLNKNPNLICLLREGETLADLLALSPEELLLRWVNYQLDKTDCKKRVSNFTSDIKDSEVYAYLMDVILKDKLVHPSGSVLSISDNMGRAQKIIQNSDAVELPGIVTAYDIANGNQKLNLIFVAELFNNFPCLEAVEQPVIVETREEKTYRNWMNSLGVKPSVNYLYNDLSSGLIILQLIDIIQPGMVNWDKVNKPPSFKGASANIKKIENCNKCVEYGKQLKLSLVGVSGDNIYNGTQTLVLALVWQLMHLYTMKILQELSGSSKPITESEIVAWANQKLSSKGLSISGFKDESLRVSLPVIELVEVMRPNTVDRSNILAGKDEEEKLMNARLAISLARRIGARIYALPEDLVEKNSKMILTIFACLMALDYKSK